MLSTTHGHYFKRGDTEHVSPCILAAIFSVRNQPSAGIGSMMLPDKWVLDYSLSPGGLCRVGEEIAPWLKREPGVAHLYPPGTRYWEDSRQRAVPWASIFIVFTGGEDAGFGTFTPFGRFHDTGGRLGELLKEMAVSGAVKGDSGFWKEQSLFFTVTDLLHTAIPLEGGLPFEWTFQRDEETCEDSLFLDKIHRVLSKRIGGKTELKDIAAELGVSSSSLSHRYRNLTGESPMRALTNLRIAMAKGLLLRGESLKNVAHETGFCDEFHFSKAFKASMGISPTEFRRRSGTTK